MKLKAVRKANSYKKLFVVVIHELGKMPKVLTIVDTRKKAENTKDDWNSANETEEKWCDFFSDVPEEAYIYE